MTETPWDNPKNDGVSEKHDVASQTEVALPHGTTTGTVDESASLIDPTVAVDDATVDDVTVNGMTVDDLESTVNSITDVHIGQLIGSMRIEERLGVGAMASIYRGHDTQSGTQLAIKVLSSAADAVLQERFRIEAQTAQKLNHPNIINVVDFGQSASGLTYIVMDLIEGEDLGTLLERHYQLSFVDACQVLQPIADALAYAHTAGVVHRDVKPSNILLRHVAPGTPGSVQLTGLDYALIPLLSDFGIARALDAPELTTTGRTIGTPAYMSPEQCSGNRALDGRADIYSLGTVLYRCLVGRPPFVGATTQILHAHVYEALTIPDELVDTLPPALLEVLRKSLQKEPTDRYGDAEEFASALAQISARSSDPMQTQPTAPTSEATATMPSLPTTASLSAQQTAHILVPGVDNQSSGRSPTTEGRASRPEKTTSSLFIPHVAGAGSESQQAARGRAAGRKDYRTRHNRRSQRSVTWIAVLLGVSLTAGIGLIVFLLFSTFDLDFLRRTPVSSAAGNSTVTASGTPPALSSVLTSTLSSPADNSETVNHGSSVTSTVIAPTVSETTAVTQATALTNTGGLIGTQGLTDTEELTNTIAISGAEQREIVQSTDDVNVVTTWGDVLHYYEIGNWGQTRWSLIAMLSAQDGIPDLANLNSRPVEQAEQIQTNLLSDEEALYWRKWSDTFQPAQVQQILADTYVGLAMMEPDPLDLPPTMLDYLEAAVVLFPDRTSLRSLNAATVRYVNASPGQQDLWASDMAQHYAAFVAESAATGSYCVAADVADAINQRVPNTIAVGDVTALQQQCGGFVASISETSEITSSLRGTIVYSTQLEDSSYAIVRTALDTTGKPAWTNVILRAATQPSISGDQLAFYNRRADSQGLSGTTLTTPSNEEGQMNRYTGAVEDAQQSPARWNPTTNELVFANGTPGNPSEMYRASPTFVGNNSNRASLGPGEDPAWSPDGTQIVFRGAVSGLGLYLMPATGGEQQQITDGDDRRPVWTGDGQSIIFMRRVDGTNWELYRLNYVTRNVVQLTYNDAQDGLPALSPDGQTVVFATDRMGHWELWTVPLVGGNPQFLMPIQGSFLQWLEHAIQWVN